MDASTNRPAHSTEASALRTHGGSCHCGAVRFEASLDARRASRCNCSACTKTGVTTAVVKPDAFTLVSGEDALSVYEWGPKISRRFFCKHCGVHCFGRGYLAEVGGDYVSINVACLEDVDLGAVHIGYWDGRHNNWQAGTRDVPWPTFAPS